MAERVCAAFGKEAVVLNAGGVVDVSWFRGSGRIGAALPAYQGDIPGFEIEAMARVPLPALRTFYDSPEWQAAFEKWKRQQENT